MAHHSYTVTLSVHWSGASMAATGHDFHIYQLCKQMEYIPGIMHMIRVLFCFIVICYRKSLHISSMVSSAAVVPLEQLLKYINVSLTTPVDVPKQQSHIYISRDIFCSKERRSCSSKPPVVTMCSCRMSTSHHIHDERKLLRQLSNETTSRESD